MPIKVSYGITKHSRTAKITPNSKGDAGEVNNLNFKLQYKAMLIVTLWYLCENRHIGQWGQTEGWTMNPHTYLIHTLYV